jgi:hypothetical protein
MWQKRETYHLDQLINNSFNDRRTNVMALYVTTYIDTGTHNPADRNLKLLFTNDEGTSNFYAA